MNPQSPIVPIEQPHLTELELALLLDQAVLPKARSAHLTVCEHCQTALQDQATLEYALHMAALSCSTSESAGQAEEWFEVSHIRKIRWLPGEQHPHQPRPRSTLRAAQRAATGVALVATFGLLGWISLPSSPAHSSQFGPLSPLDPSTCRQVQPWCQ